MHGGGRDRSGRSSISAWNSTSAPRQRQARDAPWSCGNQPAYHSMISITGTKGRVEFCTQAPLKTDITADAMAAKWRRSAAPRSLRSLRRHRSVLDSDIDLIGSPMPTQPLFIRRARRRRRIVAAHSRVVAVRVLGAIPSGVVARVTVTETVTEVVAKKNAAEAN